MKCWWRRWPGGNRRKKFKLNKFCTIFFLRFLGEMTVKMAQSGPKMCPKRHQNNSKWGQNDDNTISEWLQNDAGSTQKWSKSSKITPFWSQKMATYTPQKVPKMAQKRTKMSIMTTKTVQKPSAPSEKSTKTQNPLRILPDTPNHLLHTFTGWNVDFDRFLIKTSAFKGEKEHVFAQFCIILVNVGRKLHIFAFGKFCIQLPKT